MMSGITGKYMPGNSLLHRLDERAKFFGFLILIVATVLTNSVPGYIVMIASVLFFGKVSSLSPGVVFGAIRRMWIFFLIIFVMNALFYTSDNPIWHFWIFSLSKEGLVQGANVVLRIALIIVMSNVLTLTTSPMELMSAIETMVSPLKYIKLPAEEIAMILSIAIQFIPTLLEESDEIRKAQIARGARFESKKIREKAAAFLPLVVPIFLAAFKRADELSVAMEARGYRGAKDRTPREKKKLQKESLLAICLCMVVCAVEWMI